MISNLLFFRNYNGLYMCKRISRTIRLFAYHFFYEKKLYMNKIYSLTKNCIVFNLL